MELYGKSLVFTVFLIVVLIIVQHLLTKYNISPPAHHKDVEPIIENFVENYAQTYVQSMTPNEGDGSTLVKLEGTNFDFVSKIYFGIDKTFAQAIILQNRTNDKIEIIPPAITELNETILSIRENIKKKQEGIKVDVYFVRGDPITGQDFSLSPDDENTVKVENLNFYYIDRLPYQNNCPIPPPPPSETLAQEPAETDSLPDESPIDFVEGSDLEFLNKTLPEREEKLNNLYSSIMKNLDKYDKLNTNEIDTLEKMQAMETLEEVKKQFNYERYVITQNLMKNIKSKN